MRVGLPPHGGVLPVGEDFRSGQARMVAGGDAHRHQFAQRDSSDDLVCLQPEHLDELAVDHLQAAGRVEQGQSLRHVAERRVKPQIGTFQLGLARLQGGDVAADGDEAALAVGAAANPQPAPVGQLLLDRGHAAGCPQPAQRGDGAGRAVAEDALMHDRRLEIGVAHGALQQMAQVGHEFGHLRVGDDDAAVTVNQDQSLLQALDAVCQPRFGGAALRHLALHHALDVAAHVLHRDQQRAELVVAGAGNRRREFARGDATGRLRRCNHRSHDASVQHDGDRRRQPKTGDQAKQVGALLRANRGDRLLAVVETIFRGLVDEQVKLFGDISRSGFERRPFRLGGVRVEQRVGTLPPSCDRGHDLAHRGSDAGRQGPVGGDRQVLGQRQRQPCDLVGQGLRVRSAVPPPFGQGGLHAGEIRRRAPGVVGRYEGIVEGAHHQRAGDVDAVLGVEAEAERDQADRHEGADNLGANGQPQTLPAFRRPGLRMPMIGGQEPGGFSDDHAHDLRGPD